MSSVLVHPPEARPRSQRFAIIAAGVVASLAILAGLFALVQRPDFVSNVSVVNKSGFPLDVDVAPGTHDAVMPLGVVDAHSSESYADVIDQGDIWVVHLTDPARGSRDLRFTRSQLEHADWKVTIPADFDPKPASSSSSNASSSG